MSDAWDLDDERRLFDSDLADDFEELLADAHGRAQSERERDFLESIESRFERYGDSMFLSVKQENWLVALASRRRS